MTKVNSKIVETWDEYGIEKMLPPTVGVYPEKHLINKDNYHWFWHPRDDLPIILEWRGHNRHRNARLFDKCSDKTCWVVPDCLDAQTGEELADAGYVYIQPVSVPPVKNPRIKYGKTK